ncbi:2-amino-4-hydroxy-6-hydroxymethyldihydropteridinediphosphokinase [Alkalithermobacter thermoalcaliphilus JW-YL-7 = DSM 7308]|uniref:2-amino-4-hydroxy-6-hydroxymethyldihydropteridine diphosphokinase n=1 Tax=Alkalithermobacter thermoalcaliphilus JW-YL-7 = DSM 7308 TaxID=1121328 RepID=A0A150FQ46_CLOPD|nr:2-amino-4-hydroxy-6-hydroxymethyldihydropteridine pyrophosphokinase [[Clostridium] paradoxum JW-YL-7 = DSM 7308]SHK62639.1 2-amino-4-hydroxy-6-hydroxymethyldihydropteridinediphosphokinase [[Clostridium] paradoxum JW-YL-7 = DSM 7308]
MHNVYLSIGTNVGDREKNINDAINYISQIEKTQILKISKVYETEPWGYTNQEKFLNICVKINTHLNPYELLDSCQMIEQYLKRERIIRWGPRTIDIDILIYDDIICEDERLTIPHPRMKERAFVLIPLLDIEPNLYVDGKSIKDILSTLNEQGIKEYTKNEK